MNKTIANTPIGRVFDGKGFIINRMKRKEEAASEAAPEPSSTDKLLMEIRDSLKK